MNSRHLLPPAVVLLAAAAALGFSTRPPGAAPENARTEALKWEYKVIHYPSKDVEKALDALGEDGWELCGTPGSVSGKINNVFNGSGGSGSIDTTLTVVFKRPKR
jgi:hypothetical protein